MSRSNTNYYKRTAPREYSSRRGRVQRRGRFPKWTIKSVFGLNPPKGIMRLWRKSARAQWKAEVKRDEDPGLRTGEVWLKWQYQNWW